MAKSLSFLIEYVQFWFSYALASSNFLLWWLQVYTWGKGYCGALGHGDEVDKTTPGLLNSLKSHVAVQV